MDREKFDNDSPEIKLPEYEESSFPFPDVPAGSSFEENKDDIYRRNMIIAAMEAKTPVLREKLPENFGTKEIFPWDKPGAGDKRPGRGGFFRRAASALDSRFDLKILYMLAMLAIVTLMMVMLILAFQIRGRSKKPALDITLPQAAEEVVLTEITITAQNEVVTGTEILHEQVQEVIPEEVSVTLTEVSVLS